MTTSDDLALALEQRFGARARMAVPTPDPGPAILARSAGLIARRRRRRLGGVATGVAVLVVAAVLAVAGRTTDTRVSTATAPTTTTGGTCSVAETCQPASVSSVRVGAVPAGYRAVQLTPVTAPAGQHVVELTYAKAPSGGTVGPGQDQIAVRVITASRADTTSLAQQVRSQGWTPLAIGARSAWFTTRAVGAGTPVQVDYGYLQLQLSPTVTISLRGPALSVDELTALAISITVR